jgi:hypothetical protein
VFRGGTLLRLAALATCLAAAAVLPADADTGPATIRITDVQTDHVLVDRGRPGRGAGDVEIIRQALYNRRLSSKPIGTADVVCTMLGGSRRMCNGTYALPKGSLMTTGAIGNRLLFEVAIVGGTELYANARGTLVVTTTSLSPRRQVLVFRLAG